MMVQLFVVEIGLATLYGTSGWARLWVLVLTIAPSVSQVLSRVTRTAVIDVGIQPYYEHALMPGVPEGHLFGDLCWAVINALKALKVPLMHGLVLSLMLFCL